MPEINMSFEEIESLFREAIMVILGLPHDDNKSVRFPYGSTTDTGSAPGIKRTDNVCFVFVAPSDDGYSQQRHISYQPGGDGGALTRVDEHTDIYTVTFTCYGSSAYEWARKIRDGFYREDITRLLKSRYFFLKTGIPPIVQLNELRDGEWWRRFDISATFYSFARLEQSRGIGTIEHVNIRLNPETRV